MTKEQLEALKATMPWKHRVLTHPQLGGLVQVINNRGEEVPMFDMLAFLEVITARVAPEAKEEKP